jgi:hypothetical protein
MLGKKNKYMEGKSIKGKSTCLSVGVFTKRNKISKGHGWWQ